MSYVLHAWQVSPYSAKVRAYLRYKGIAFEEKAPNAIALGTKIKRAVGASIMPTLEGKGQHRGQWLQDSREILNVLEERHPDPITVPEGNRQRIATRMLEVYADEWLPAVALHYRWSIPENHRFALEEFARNGFPRLPDFAGRRLVAPIAKKMQSYLPFVGVDERTVAGIEATTKKLIAALDKHLEGHLYLLGGRPSVGDFALYGPLWAHLYRDPGSTQLFDDAPAVKAWFERLHRNAVVRGEFLPDDEIPETLEQVLRIAFEDAVPYFATLVAKINEYGDAHPEAKRIPRALGTAEITFDGHQGERKLITFAQWKLQHALAPLKEASPQAQDALQQWLKHLGAEALAELQIRYPMERHNFKLRLKR